jgi:drug/metabolite transporter (DMT)-like permease
VAVIHGCADDGIPWLTGGVLAEVIHGASVAIVTNRTNRFRRIVADPGLGEADAYVVALTQGFTHNGLSAYTGAIEAAVIGGAEAVVVAGGAVVFVGEDAITRRRVAEHSGLALVGIWAVKIRYWSTNATSALFSQGAEAAIVARSAVFFKWSRAAPSGRVAGARDVAIVQRGADQVFSSATVSIQAVLSRATGVSIIA